MILKYFVFSISIAFVSWTVALMITPAIAKSRFYQTKLTHLNFIPGENANKVLGMEAFKWLVIKAASGNLRVGPDRNAGVG